MDPSGFFIHFEGTNEGNETEEKGTDSTDQQGTEQKFVKDIKLINLAMSSHAASPIPEVAG